MLSPSLPSEGRGLWGLVLPSNLGKVVSAGLTERAEGGDRALVSDLMYQSRLRGGCFGVRLHSSDLPGQRCPGAS